MQIPTYCLMLEQKKKFSSKELHVGLSKVKPSKKRKKSTSHEVVVKKTRTETTKERVEVVAPISLTLISYYGLPLWSG